MTSEATLEPFPQEHLKDLHPKVKSWFVSLRDKVNGLDNAASQEQKVGVSGTIQPNSPLIRLQSTGGAITLTSNPQISAPLDGVDLKIEGTSDVNTVTLVNGNGLSLAGGTNFVVKNNSVITFHYNSDKQVWIENYRRT